MRKLLVVAKIDAGVKHCDNCQYLGISKLMGEEINVCDLFLGKDHNPWLHSLNKDKGKVLRRADCLKAEEKAKKK